MKFHWFRWFSQNGSPTALHSVVFFVIEIPYGCRLIGTFFLSLSFSVWQQLEQQNPLFFKAYDMRLMLKNQIMVFNRLLQDQFEIMNKEFSSGIPSMSLPNGSNSNLCKTFPAFLSWAGIAHNYLT